ncbi:endonuclease/exonuclease/phosphatase family protein [Spongiivirga citrea]|uniref:endonuclease/exonuclease/phosphatase family protein n=1 Tax=Spongiivirga citrea TaxID=1481457 RepID=UPI001EF8D28E|nr:endonuclease/exonuclease/phosphatase family protein [Spongiivirga citrea]
MRIKLNHIIIIILVCFFLPYFSSAQLKEKKFKVHTIAFYNVENLFDTINNPNTFDDDRTPEGKDRWTKKNYLDKIDKLSGVISNIGAEISKNAPAIVGLAEIENRQVIEDLIAHPNLSKWDYGIVHFNSRDARGIDVALIYRRNVFNILSFNKHELHIVDSQTNLRQYTRDQLVVTGILEGDEVSFIVNHWPSRRGGTARSGYKREAAAYLTKRLIDSISNITTKPKILIMGDFNDDPNNKSINKVLRANEKIKPTDSIGLYNPMMRMFKKGLGTLAYRDNWNLFDQFLVSPQLLDITNKGFRYWKAGIYNPDYLVAKEGKYKGYPLRAYSNGVYAGGFSDHFPVYVYLIKEL